jgi:hypothetical protein
MNGRDKVTADVSNQACTQGSGVGSVTHGEQVHNGTLFPQPHASAQQLLQQQMNLHQQVNLVARQLPAQVSSGSIASSGSFQHNPIMMQNAPFSVDALNTSAAIDKARALIAQSISGSKFHQQANCDDPNSVQGAQVRLARLNNDIANCEEQLAVLERLRALKEMRRQLSGDVSPRGVSPSSTA